MDTRGAAGHSGNQDPPASADMTLAAKRRDQWDDIHATARNWNPWGTRMAAACDEEEDHTTEREAGPQTNEEYQTEMRWKLRDKCLRVATFYRVMHLRARALRIATRKRLRLRFTVWSNSFIEYTRHTARQSAHDTTASHARASRQGQVSAQTRMHMTAPDLYRETRRNAPRRPHATNDQPQTRRKRLTSLMDTEIGRASI